METAYLFAKLNVHIHNLNLPVFNRSMLKRTMFLMFVLDFYQDAFKIQNILVKKYLLFLTWST